MIALEERINQIRGLRKFRELHDTSRFTARLDDKTRQIFRRLRDEREGRELRGEILLINCQRAADIAKEFGLPDSFRQFSILKAVEPDQTLDTEDMLTSTYGLRSATVVLAPDSRVMDIFQQETQNIRSGKGALSLKLPVAWETFKSQIPDIFQQELLNYKLRAGLINSLRWLYDFKFGLIPGESTTGENTLCELTMREHFETCSLFSNILDGRDLRQVIINSSNFDSVDTVINHIQEWGMSETSKENMVNKIKEELKKLEDDLPFYQRKYEQYKQTLFRQILLDEIEIMKHPTREYLASILTEYLNPRDQQSGWRFLDSLNDALARGKTINAREIKNSVLNVKIEGTSYYVKVMPADRAEREYFITSILHKDPELSRYMPKIMNAPLGFNGPLSYEKNLAIMIYEDASEKPSAMQSSQIKTHQMYVLALLHHQGSKVIEKIPKAYTFKYMSPEELGDRLRENKSFNRQEISTIVSFYENAFETIPKSRALAHNDVHPANWSNGCIIDFESVSVSHEYADLSACLFDLDTYSTPEKTRENFEQYLTFRRLLSGEKSPTRQELNLAYQDFINVAILEAPLRMGRIMKSPAACSNSHLVEKTQYLKWLTTERLVPEVRLSS